MTKQLEFLATELGTDAMAQAQQFLRNRYPAGYKKRQLEIALKAIKRQREGREVGALERAFS